MAQQGRRQQARKKNTGIGRGHGKHHRRGDGAPRSIGTGRKRIDERQRERGWAGRDDDELEDLPLRQRLKTQGERLQELDDADSRGAKLEGLHAPGTVVELHKGCCLVQLKDPPNLPEGWTPLPPLLRATPRGLFKKFDVGKASLVAVGDAVEVVIPPTQGNEEYEAIVARVEPRRTEFRRMHPSGRAIQTLSANVDRIVIVSSAGQPPFRPGFVDRVLVCAQSSHLPAALVLNKSDLGVKSSDEELLAVYRDLGVQVFITSALRGEGLDALKELLASGRNVLCGHSGVGKSSLLAALSPDRSAEIRVGEISDYTGRGTHTTTHAKLYRFPWGEAIDTPGIREFTPADTDRKNLWGWFPEIASRRDECGFSDCTHLHEKNCAVLKALEEGEIHPRRHESYERIYQTLPV